MPEYSERDLVLPALILLKQSKSGLTTSQLIQKLTALLKPDGRDAQILRNRRDTHFSQKVRNLVSHRTLEKRGWATYDPSRQHHKITNAGRKYVDDALQTEGLPVAPLASGSRPAGVILRDYISPPVAQARKQAQPFTVDPNVQDRALEAHNQIIRSLAEWLRSRGIEPLSAGGEIDFDLAWRHDQRLFVVEAKSLADANETSQLRLGLGQVLHYALQLEESLSQTVCPILAVEREPRDSIWLRLCAKHGVVLVWEGAYEQLSSAIDPNRQ